MDRVVGDSPPSGRPGREPTREGRRAGHDVTYREFEGPPTVPPAITRRAVEWAFAR